MLLFASAVPTKKLGSKNSVENSSYIPSPGLKFRADNLSLESAINPSKLRPNKVYFCSRLIYNCAIFLARFASVRPTVAALAYDIIK